MNKLAIPLIVIIVAIVIVVPQTLFIVDETQLAIVTRFGEFKRVIDKPGLQVKTPFVERVTKFDSRLLRVDVIPESILTEDKRNLVIDSYARYRITQPLLFFQALGSETLADSSVNDIVRSRLRAEVARDLQSEVISETREDIMNRVTVASNQADSSREELQLILGRLDHASAFIFVDESPGDDELARLATRDELVLLESNSRALGEFEVTYRIDLEEKFGIQIIDVRIKRADFPPDIESSVFSRMEAERERIASGLRAEGTQQDSEIRARVDREINIILQSASGESALLRGEAEQEAIEILAVSLEKNPEFYAFRRSLDAYRVFMDSQTTVILDPDSDLLRYLQSAGDGS
jgi:membrane protease subunit HflC